jgi:hypothetical protein
MHAHRRPDPAAVHLLRPRVVMTFTRRLEVAAKYFASGTTPDSQGTSG